MRPVIGITAYAEQARWGAWDLPAALLPLMYVQKVDEAGGRALLVPPSEHGVEETLDALDGLILSGGADLDPDVYGADPHPETTGTRPDRDAAELALLAAALERDMPVLAICRGSQVLNVARGGDLVQHLPEVVGGEQHKETPGVFADHDVRSSRERRSGRCSASGRRSSRTITRASAASARGSGRSPGPRTARSRRSRTRTGSSPSACSGIPRRARTTRSSARSSSRRATTDASR